MFCRKRTFGRTWLLLVALITMLVGSITLIQAPSAHAVTLPTGFVDGLVTSILQPTALGFTPDGRMLISTKEGQLQVYKDGVTVQALDLSTKLCSQFERGLVGLAVDPDFGQGSNRSIYLYYTFKRSSSCPMGNGSNPDTPPDLSTYPVNRVSKFTLADDNTVALSSEVVILDNIHSQFMHNGGHLESARWTESSTSAWATPAARCPRPTPARARTPTPTAPTTFWARSCASTPTARCPPTTPSPPPTGAAATRPGTPGRGTAPRSGPAASGTPSVSPSSPRSRTRCTSTTSGSTAGRR